MPTQTGLGGLGDIVSQVAEYNLAKRRLDLESRGDDRNIPDRVDAREGFLAGGVGGGNATFSTLSPIELAALGVAAIAVLGLLFKLVRG